MSIPLATYKSGNLEAIEIHDGIYKIDNFLTAEEMSILRAQADGTPREGWEEQYRKLLWDQGALIHGENNHEEIEAFIDRNQSQYWDDKVIPINDASVRDSINQKLLPFFEGSYDLDLIVDIQRQYPGVGLDEHVDAEYDKNLKLAVAVYINDDFTGGELYFPKLEFEIKPTAGSCIIFATTDEYLHGIRPLGPGASRYAMVVFAWNLGTMESSIAEH